MITFLHALVLGALLGWLALISGAAHRLIARFEPKPEPLPKRTPQSVDNTAYLAHLADTHPMAERPQIGPGWREGELPELDPATKSQLHDEARKYLADAAAP